MTKIINWKHGCIAEVARVFAEQGIRDITYQISPKGVYFLSEGYFLAFYPNPPTFFEVK